MGLRRMVHVDGASGCITLNAATVPRVCSKPPPVPAAPAALYTLHPAPGGDSDSSESCSAAAASTDAASGGVVKSYRHFLVVDMVEGRVGCAKDVWVEVVRVGTGAGAGGQQCVARVALEQEVVRATSKDGGRHVSAWDAYEGKWVDTFFTA